MERKSQKRKETNKEILQEEFDNERGTLDDKSFESGKLNIAERKYALILELVPD